MEDLTVLKSIMMFFSNTDTSSLLVNTAISVLVVINVFRITGLLHLLRILFGYMTESKNNQSENSGSKDSKLLASIYTEIFNNHVLFNDRIELLDDKVSKVETRISKLELKSEKTDASRL